MNGTGTTTNTASASLGGVVQDTDYVQQNNNPLITTLAITKQQRNVTTNTPA